MVSSGMLRRVALVEPHGMRTSNLTSKTNPVTGYAAPNIRFL
jgi:hypothetical protein